MKQTSLHRKIINVYDSRGVKIAGAFTQERAFAHAKRIAGEGARLIALRTQGGDQIGYVGGSNAALKGPAWIYIRLSEVLA